MFASNVLFHLNDQDGWADGKGMTVSLNKRALQLCQKKNLQLPILTKSFNLPPIWRGEGQKATHSPLSLWTVFAWLTTRLGGGFSLILAWWCWGWNGLHIFSEKYDQTFLWSEFTGPSPTLLTHLLSTLQVCSLMFDRKWAVRKITNVISSRENDTIHFFLWHILLLVIIAVATIAFAFGWRQTMASSRTLQSIGALFLSCLLRALSIVQTAYNTFGIIQLSSFVSCVLCPREKIHPPMKENVVQCTACKRECKCKCKCKRGEGEKSRLARLHLFQCVPM